MYYRIIYWILGTAFVTTVASAQSSSGVQMSFFSLSGFGDGGAQPAQSALPFAAMPSVASDPTVIFAIQLPFDATVFGQLPLFPVTRGGSVNSGLFHNLTRSSPNKALGLLDAPPAEISLVPEPSTYMLLGFAIVGAAAWQLRRRKISPRTRLTCFRARDL